MKYDKKKLKEALLLYLVSDTSWLQTGLIEDIEQSLLGGVTCVQYREKKLNKEQMIEEAMALKKLCNTYKVPFIMNDYIDVALAIHADGIHVGQHDLDAVCVREQIGQDKILGVSVQNVEQALKAQQAGADYLGVGAIFNTTTKQDADTLSIATLTQICKSVSIPVVAIGGITYENVKQLQNTHIAGIAVVSAILANEKIKATSEILKNHIKGIII